MSTKWRRFEVMLPRQFNDGRDVPPEWISLATLEIGDHFGSVSYETQIIEGRWQHAGIAYRALKLKDISISVNLDDKGLIVAKKWSFGK
jgi:hypothetical protein